MHYQEPFLEHLKSLSKNDWERLWALIPIIEQTDEFGHWEGIESIGVGMQMPYFVAGEEIEQFLSVVQDLGLIPIFDWMDWAEGKHIVSSADFRPKDHTLESHCKILTVIIRGNRFNEGLVGNCFEQGLVLKLLKSMKAKVEAGELERG